MQVMIDSFSFLECCVYGREQGVFILRGECSSKEGLENL